MKRPRHSSILPLVLIASALVPSLVRADGAGASADAAAITSTVEQYVLGFYEGDGAAVLAVCHPQLSKHGVAHSYLGAPFEHLDEITYEQLGWLADHYNADGRFDPQTARREVRILDQIGDYAAAELVAGDWTDFFHLARMDGTWKIVNVAWWAGTPEEGDRGTEDDRAAIETSIRNYVDGYYRVEPDLTVSHVHHQLDKRTLRQTPQGTILQEMSREQLRHVASVGNAGENRRIDPQTARADVTIHSILGDTASARLDAEDWFDFFHLVRIDGEWTIVNVLWAPTHM